MGANVESLFQKYGPRYRWFAAITMMLGTTSMVLATTIVNVAIPDIMDVFRMSQDTAQWLSTGFLAATAGTMLMTPWCVRRYGQRATYIVTLCVFIAASLLGGLSSSTEFLIVSRILQGAMAGIIQPLAMITIFSVFPPDQRGRAMGVYGLGVVLAPAVGPALGGFLVDHFGWQAVFFIAIPFCVAGVIMAPFFITGSEPADPSPAFDWGGLATSSAFLLTFLYGLSASHKHGWTSAPTVISLALAALSAIGFVWWELHRSHPMLEVRIFSNNRFLAASVVSFTYGIGLFGSTYLIPLFVQTVAHYRAAHAGLLLTPAGIALACVLPFSGRLADKMSAHYIVGAGLMLFALSSYLFSTAGAATGFWALAWWIVIGRIGLGMIIPALNAGAIQSLDVTYIGQGSSAVNFVRQIGGAFGVNVLATILEWRTAAHSGLPEPRIAAFHDSFMVVTLVFGLALVPAWLMSKKRSA